MDLYRLKGYGHSKIDFYIALYVIFRIIEKRRKRLPHVDALLRNGN